jgi:hypothetical protein
VAMVFGIFAHKMVLYAIRELTKIISQKYDLKIDFLNKLQKIDKLSKIRLFATVFIFNFDINI